MSVWVVLRDAATVELTVWPGLQRSSGPGAVEGGVPHVAQGSAQTRRFGAKLHVAVVTARADGTVIAPGTVHSYDLMIGGAGLRGLGLLRDETEGNRLPGVEPVHAPLHLALGYELDRLPSFATPAPVLTDLCLANASCRRTNAHGPDALAFLDALIEEERSDPTRRPQQLFLTGPGTSSRRIAERVPVGIEGIGAIDTAHEPLARSTIPDVEKHAVFDSIPEEGDFDPVALLSRLTDLELRALMERLRQQCLEDYRQRPPTIHRQLTLVVA